MKFVIQNFWSFNTTNHPTPIWFISHTGVDIDTQWLNHNILLELQLGGGYIEETKEQMFEK